MSPRATQHWQVVGASVVGTSHVSAGRGCDDRHVHHEQASGLVIGVADGAGSAPRSGEGAQIATEAVAARRRNLVAAAGRKDPEALREALIETLVLARNLLDEQLSEDVPLGYLATTLSIVVVGRTHAGVAHVGDGAVVLSTQEGLRLIPSERSEYINETTFLTSDRFARTATLHVEPSTDISAVAAMTDGLQMLALDMATVTPHAPFFDPLFAFARSDMASDTEIEAFLGSERVNARTDDDKTLVLAVTEP